MNKREHCYENTPTVWILICAFRVSMRSWRITADSGGKVTAARKIICGRRKIVRLFYHLGLKAKGLLDFRIVSINGELGTVTVVFRKSFTATAFEIEDGKIRRVYNVMNPEKLKSFFSGITGESN